MPKFCDFFPEDVASEEVADNFSSSYDIQEQSPPPPPPPEQEVNPDFVLIDDMILSPLQYDVIYTEPSKRNGYSPVVRAWPNAVIPYMIDDDYSINDIYCGQSFSLHI